MLGRAVAEALVEGGVDVTPLGHTELDLSRAETIEAAISVDSPRYDWVFNCAAYTDVDGAESDAALADAINGYGVGALAKCCAAVDATLIHYGSDYVFDGIGKKPYPVDHPLAPVNAYGRSKALGERLMRESGVHHLYLRTSWLYAPWGNNFVLTMAGLTRDNDRLTVVDDQRGRPTSCRQLARATLELLDAGAAGTLHVTDGGECSWYDLARVVRDARGHECEIVPCTSAEYPRPAPRPAYSVLDLSLAEAILGPMAPYEEAVACALDAAPDPGRAG
ncbi:MAG: dTDP-4-dehydrorhamnose reductase [Deltaproteobacteria bacterium]|nr:dTDP-4-dehydrorhamnose reductase [Deltaproteobacteria bacterium]